METNKPRQTNKEKDQFCHKYVLPSFLNRINK